MAKSHFSLQIQKAGTPQSHQKQKAGNMSAFCHPLFSFTCVCHTINQLHHPPVPLLSSP
ncbi:hypothetical protein [Moraxella lacunata]|uniref:hypothetical protein n=1 Tax=Moraxella lacunata TaxID=477 RepID=UPI003EE07B29